jgi:hypothetical protein
VAATSYFQGPRDTWTTRHRGDSKMCTTLPTMSEAVTRVVVKESRALPLRSRVIVALADTLTMWSDHDHYALGRKDKSGFELRFMA